MLLALLLLFGLPGCGRVRSDFYYDLGTAPVNLDPQSASDYASRLVIANLFEGLLQVGEGGGILPAAAERYMVSDDGLTYRFFLREDGAWENGDPVTAADFVWAFQRLFNADTNAPLASSFFCIENAEAVLGGGLPPSSLGVAAEGERTLVIRLSAYNARFLYLLTTAPAMPCNRAFFTGTRGKYGLSDKVVMGNGPFCLSLWDPDQLRLKRSESYSGEIPAQSVRLNILDKMDSPGTVQERFLEGRTSAAALDSLGSLAEEMTWDSSENTVWGISFNTAREPFSEPAFRKALLYALDFSAGEGALPAGAAQAGAIIPQNILLGGESYRAAAGKHLMPRRDAAAAWDYYQQGLAALGRTKLSGLTIILPDTGGHDVFFGYLAQGWQRDLGLYLTVEALPAAAYQRRLREGSFDLALCALTSSYNSPHGLLEQFEQGNGGNFWGFADETFDGMLAAAELTADSKTALSQYLQAEKLLIDEAVFLPLYYQSEYFVMGEGVSGIVYDFDSKIVRFQYARRAK
ncbi:MAG: peptide ABC transporter substrate-binding protein [Oscillospiraceae bacterium]|nr:peptide ABC transporter substrate-binding protein [Oscillospiraceae bacterium]